MIYTINTMHENIMIMIQSLKINVKNYNQCYFTCKLKVLTFKSTVEG